MGLVCILGVFASVFVFFFLRPKWPLRQTRVLMGTFVQVLSNEPRAFEVVFSEIERLESLLSKYRPESEISRLNAAKKMQVSKEVFQLLKKAVEFCQLTDGAFDITVGSLMDVWGFTDKAFVVPDDSKIRQALGGVGCGKIILNEETKVVEFSNPAVKLDLGGIAKGYALDCAVEKLRQAGIKNCLINAGGQVYALGRNLGKKWRVGIRCGAGEKRCGVLEVEDCSVATSADYEQFFLRGKKRYGHIMNPKTGYPADSGIASVTVVAKEGAVADALATAIFVLGREKAKKVLRNFPDAKAIIFEQNNPNPIIIGG